MNRNGELKTNLILFKIDYLTEGSSFSLKKTLKNQLQ